MGDGYIKQIRAYAANARLLLVLPVVIRYVDDGADPPTRNPSSNHPCRIRNVPSLKENTEVVELQCTVTSIGQNRSEFKFNGFSL